MTYYLFIEEGKEPDWAAGEAHIIKMLSLPVGKRVSTYIEEDEGGPEYQMIKALLKFKDGWTGEEHRKHLRQVERAQKKRQEAGREPLAPWMYGALEGGVEKHGVIGGFLFVTVSPDDPRDPVEPDSYFVMSSLEDYGLLKVLGFVEPERKE